MLGYAVRGAGVWFDVETRIKISTWIADLYNTRRRPSANDGLAPIPFERHVAEARKTSTAQLRTEAAERRLFAPRGGTSCKEGISGRRSSVDGEVGASVVREHGDTAVLRSSSAHADPVARTVRVPSPGVGRLLSQGGVAYIPQPGVSAVPSGARLAHLRPTRPERDQFAA